MSVSKKNAPCPCGSGKKYKQCCRKKNIRQNKKKTRHQTITMDMGEKIAIDEYRISKNGKVELLKNGKTITPKAAYSSTFIERDKGEKVLSKVPVNSTNMNLNQIHAIMNYNMITAIDTNSIEIRNNKISVACTAILKSINVQEKISYEIIPTEAYEFWNVSDNPETLAWAIHISQIMQAKEFNESFNVGIVTDSELGSHDSYNDRTAPIYKNFFLPKQFTLLYGSSDKGVELTNMLIKSCDKWSKKVLDRIKNDENLSNLKIHSNKPYSHSRYWPNLQSAEFLK